ncbi:MAG: hypothetical protein FD181_3000 [Prolixibacteraceae bacterium]|nr:MAG: hypothetical protein FD181_3000 [Prolixibacteraceae bacterium]
MPNLPTTCSAGFFPQIVFVAPTIILRTWGGTGVTLAAIFKKLNFYLQIPYH